jgi:ribosomal protein S18 acetylase RimI-like enzyme
MALARDLFLEYQAWLDVDLCFQGFEAELASLPGGYAPPLGGLWFAQVDGVVGLRPLETDGVAEMKRLWVRPDYRGLGLGRRLAETTVAAARSAGYRSLCLDTLPMMARAHGLYASLGFREAVPYYHNPLDGVVYLELDLLAQPVESA